LKSVLPASAAAVIHSYMRPDGRTAARTGRKRICRQGLAARHAEAGLSLCMRLTARDAYAWIDDL
jgi:hypothetical protein